MHTASARLVATKLAALANCDPRTAARWRAGLPVSHVSRGALERAARELGLVQPSPSNDVAPRPVALSAIAHGAVR